MPCAGNSELTVQECMQAGSSLTLGAAIISLIYPIKMGTVGYAMVLYSLFQSSLAVLSPALIFLPILMIATNVLGFLEATRRRANPVQAAPATDAAAKRIPTAPVPRKARRVD
jgi:hypothetical protein